MYIPSAFSETDLSRLHEFMEAHSFGLLVSHEQGRMEASHLPLLLERGDGRNGCLYGHMARANSQWKHANGTDVLAVFSGPHSYVSPAWYESDDVVPTWNYTAVHAYGRLEIIEDVSSLRALLLRQVRTYENSRSEPWTFEDSSEFAARLLPAIVGFRIEITRLEGKWKLSQNQPRERRERVIQQLNSMGDAESVAVANLMAAALNPPQRDTP